MVLRAIYVRACLIAVQDQKILLVPHWRSSTRFDSAMLSIALAQVETRS